LEDRLQRTSAGSDCRWKRHGDYPGLNQSHAKTRKGHLSILPKRRFQASRGPDRIVILPGQRSSYHPVLRVGHGAEGVDE
jgi:hypothetical protein